MLSFHSLRETGGQENGEDGAGSHDEVARRQQQRYTNRRLGGRAAEAVEAGKGRDRGLTLGPPPPLPTTGVGAGAGAGAGTAGKVSPDQTVPSPGASDAPHEADQFEGELIFLVWL